MNREKKRLSPLAEVELEALDAGREWTRRRIEKNLQKLADEQGAISPPEQSPDETIATNDNPNNDQRRRCGD